MTKTDETRIALLERDKDQMAKDLAELREDVKAIKTFLMGSETEEPKVITRKEFEIYKSSQRLNKVVIAVVTAVATSMASYIVLKELGKII